MSTSSCRSPRFRRVAAFLPRGSITALVLLACVVAAPAAAQFVSGAPPGLTLPSVFLDCQGQLPCNRDHFRTEILFVNWARDREDADVHVIATSEGVGGGGQRITLDFLGRREMADLSDRLTYTSRGSDVLAETLDGVTQVLRLGLMRYAIESGVGPSFDLRFAEAARATGPGDDDDSPPSPSTVPEDPWDFWTFRVSLSGEADLRETSTSIELNPSLSAERITEAWKFGFEGEINAERDRRELSGGRIVRDDRDEWELETLLVRSVSNHISFGFAFEGERSVSENQNARVEFAPAVEYNYYPYAEANRRQLTVTYSGGFQYSDYNEETIFNVFSETRPQHELGIRYSAREGWGNAGLGIGYSQYLNDMDLYRAEVNGNVSFRITRGLDLNLSGSSSWVRDEIHIPLSDISDEDILLGRLNLPSSYEYAARIGIGYRWGSAFANIVNARFSSGF